MSATSANPSLRIAILGTGKIGSTFAFQLSRVGHHDVTVIARPGSVRLAQLQRDQAIIDVNGNRAQVQICEVLDEDAPYDLVIVTCLDHQTTDLLPNLKRNAAKTVLFMFNTFRPERLSQAVGVDRCAFGMPFVQARLDDNGKLKAMIGAGGQKTLLGAARWVDLFSGAGLPAKLEADMPLWLRCHAPVCVAFESVSVAGETRGGGASWTEAMVLAQGVQACFGLIRGLGYLIYPQG